MKFHQFTFLLISFIFLSSHLSYGQVDEKVDARYVRVLENDDGSRTVFRRSPDDKTLTKKRFSTEGNLLLLTIYRMDKKGNPRSCKIYDADGGELFRVRYGYDRQTRRLVEEQMFDSRVKRLNPQNGDEMPVRRFIYTYDAQGNRSKPFAISYLPGEDAKEAFKKDQEVQPSALESNPFHDDLPGS